MIPAKPVTEPVLDTNVEATSRNFVFYAGETASTADPEADARLARQADKIARKDDSMETADLPWPPPDWKDGERFLEERETRRRARAHVSKPALRDVSHPWHPDTTHVPAAPRLALTGVPRDLGRWGEMLRWWSHGYRGLKALTPAERIGFCYHQNGASKKKKETDYHTRLCRDLELGQIEVGAILASLARKSMRATVSLVDVEGPVSQSCLSMLFPSEFARVSRAVREFGLDSSVASLVGPVYEKIMIRAGLIFRPKGIKVCGLTDLGKERVIGRA